MTPEQAACYRLMLTLGLETDYDKALDQALETEDPLSELTLQLASCASSPRETISVLHHYTEVHVPDQEAVYRRMLEELRRRYVSGVLSMEDCIAMMDSLLSICGSEGPWMELWQILGDYELLEFYPISTETFREVFEAWLLRGERVDLLELSRQKREKRTIRSLLKKIWNK